MSARTGSLLVIFLTVFIDLLGFGIVLPLLPIYGRQFARLHDYTPDQIGWITGLLMSSFSAMQFLFMPLWGRLSDRIGRRPVLLIGLSGSTFFYAMFGMATLAQSLVGLFIARIGAGIAGATISTAQAYIADTTTKENRAKGMALIGAAFALGFTLGPSIGAVALVMGGGNLELSPWPGYAASVFSGLALLLALFKLPESHTPGVEASPSGAKIPRLIDPTALRNALATPSIGLLLATSFIAVTSFAMFESSLSLQIERILKEYAAGSFESQLLADVMARVSTIGYDHPDKIVVFAAFGYLGIVLTLAQGFLVRRLAGRLSEGTLASAGAVTAIVGFAGLAYAATNDDFGLLIASMAIEVTGFALVNPSLQSLISRRSNPEQQGGILGLAQSAASLARIIGPVISLRLFAASPVWPYGFATGLLSLGLVMIVVAARSGRDYENA
jgi:MFS family permease